MTKRTAKTEVELMDARKVAELLGMTLGAVRTARSRGLLPRAAKIPGVGLRWRRADIELWLEAQFGAPGAA